MRHGIVDYSMARCTFNEEAKQEVHSSQAMTDKGIVNLTWVGQDGHHEQAHTQLPTSPFFL